MILNIIILITLIIVLLYIIKYIINKNKIVYENFRITHDAPESLIIKDCVHGFSKDVDHSDHKEEFCYKHGFVSDPALLAGICGEKNKPLHIIKDKENLYYGCIGEKNHKINWEFNKNRFTNFDKYELTPFLSNNITLKNMYPSTLVLFLTADDNAVVKENNKTYNHNNWKTFSTFTMRNIKYNTQISCSFTNTGGSGGFCIAYIWNGQLFIMSINEFDSSINSIQFNENINNQILKNNYNSSIPNMPSFMYNWYSLPKINNPQNISFNVGSISNMASFMNNMTVYLAINGTGVIKLNSKTEYKYSTPNKLVNFNISNVLLGDELIIDCKGNDIKKDSPLLTIAYIYKGFIFVLDNKSKETNDIIESSNIISGTCEQWNKRYVKDNSVVIPPFMTGWLASKEETKTFIFSTYIGTKK